MRVLNRIVRVTDEGLLYEADPRHAEMLIKDFQLEDAKEVVTPGVNVPDSAGDPDKIDKEIAAESHNIIAELSPKVHAMSKVQFDDNVDYRDVVTYSYVYGQHPREFDFDKIGQHIVSIPKSMSNDEMVPTNSVNPNMRRTILERLLRNGAAWEVPAVE